MRKRILAAALAALLALSLSACGGGKGQSGASQSSPDAETEVESEESAQETQETSEPEESSTASRPSWLDEIHRSDDGIPTYVITGRNFNKSEDYYTIARGSCETIALTEEAQKDFPRLGEALDSWSETFYADTRAQYEEIESNSISAWEQEAEKSYNFPYGELDAKVEPVRQDGNVLSFFCEFYGFNTGAAHGFTFYRGFNYDSASGKEIALEDVFKDPASLKSVLAEKLRTRYEDLFITDPEENLAYYFDGKMDSLVWTIDTDGVIFRFAPGDLSSYAAGMMECKLLFSEDPSLFTGRFGQAEGAFVRHLSSYYPTMLDLDADGQAEEVSVYGSYENGDNPYAFVSLNVSVDGETCSREDYFYGVSSLLIHLEDGRNYIYAVTSSDNDYKTISVYEIADGVPEERGSLSGTGFAVSYYYEDPDMEKNYTLVHPVLDPARFSLATRTNFMSTYSAVREYEVGDGGMPWPLTMYYEVPGARTLTSKIPLTVDLVDPKTGELTGKSEELPAGTACRIWHTDRMEWVDLMLDDGKVVRVYVTQEWPQTVNGVELEEAFEGIMFAG